MAELVCRYCGSKVEQRGDDDMSTWVTAWVCPEHGILDDVDVVEEVLAEESESDLMVSEKTVGGVPTAPVDGENVMYIEASKDVPHCITLQIEQDDPHDLTNVARLTLNAQGLDLLIDYLHITRAELASAIAMSKDG